MAVHRVKRIVDVERDRGWRAPVAVAELIHHRRHQPRNLDLRRRILQPRHGGLRAQRIAALRRMAHRHLEDRIVPQRIAIVAVLIARRDCKHPQPKHILKRMHDGLRLAPFPDARRKARRQPVFLLDLAQQKHASVGRQQSAVECNTDLFAHNRWKVERQ
jgi:hypothetical protein